MLNQFLLVKYSYPWVFSYIQSAEQGMVAREEIVGGSKYILMMGRIGKHN